MSEEMNQLKNNPPRPQSNVAQPSWETQLHQRANELLAQRIGPLKAEIERLQASFTDISARLLEHAKPETTEEESSWLLDHVRQWFSDSSSKAEEDFKARLEQACNQAAADAREETGREFQSRLEEAGREFQWRLEEAGREFQSRLEEAEREFQSRLEKERIEWHAAAAQANEAELQRRLEAARIEADAATRLALDTQLTAKEAEFQRRIESACSEAAVVARRESDAQIEDLREQLEASRKALTLAVSSAQNTTFDTLRAAIEDIDAQRSQSDTLAALVRRAAHFAPRVVFFVVKGGDAVGWRASGFENGLNDETAKLLTVKSNTQSLLGQALSNFQTAIGASASPGENSAVLGLYGSPAPERAVAVPLVVRGKSAAVLYADSGVQSENSINIAAIETLMRVASMGIELLPSRRGSEPSRPVAASAQATDLSPAITAAPARAPVAEAPTAPEVRQPVHLDTQPVKTLDDWRLEQVHGAPPASEPSTTADRLQSAEAQSHLPSQIEAEPFSAPDTEEMPTIQIDQPSQLPLSVVPPPAPPAFAESKQAEFTAPESIQIGHMGQPGYVTEEVVAEAVPTPIFSPPLTPAAPFSPAPEPPRQPQTSVPTPASETEQRAHNDARRFARLLVSEIKLYNAAKVNDGRRNFDLYDRLKDEIDRSRKVYDKRVSPAVAARFDYFYDELVQTLAEGDPAKLGDSCPGPVVLAS